MIDVLIDNYVLLEQIRKYLIKKGKARYLGKVAETKLNEATNIFEKCSELILLLESKKDPQIISSATDIFKNTKKLYETIKTLCTSPSIESVKMEFDLKTACSLLPVMDDSENVTKRLIDGIEMYSDMIGETDKDLLIKFILKSRLSENAKLRMASKYSSVTELIKDMRTHLLTKKSFTAIQSRLQNISQGQRSIEEYGSEIEKLFTDLTISQADGDYNKYDILKPLNEKLAIRKFSEGIKGSKLSTIIAARNYSSLKDAIQAAKDEECSLSPGASTSNGNVMHYSGKSYSHHRGKRGTYGNNFNGHRHQGHRGRGAQGRGHSSNRYARGNNYGNRGNRSISYHNSGYFRGSRFRNNQPLHNRGNTRQIYSAQATDASDYSAQTQTAQVVDQADKFFRDPPRNTSF